MFVALALATVKLLSVQAEVRLVMAVALMPFHALELLIAVLQVRLLSYSVEAPTLVSARVLSTLLPLWILVE